MSATAPLIAAKAAARTEVRISTSLIAPSELNPRKTVDPVALDQLTQSIGKRDIQVALLLRPRKLKWFAQHGSGHVWYLCHVNGRADGNIVKTFSGGKSEEENKAAAEAAALAKNGPEIYEVIAGSRRRLAAIALALVDVPCIVREMTDDEARELALVDNLQREDMPALEEADAYESLRQQLGTAEAIAARVGKPVEYVAKRLRLVALGDLQRQALAERLITIDHALYLARLGVEEQDKNLKWALDVNAGIKTTVAAVVTESIKRRDQSVDSRWGAWEPQSVAKLKNHIEQHAGRALSKAPWDLEDAALVKAAGACASCRSNTAHNTSLFSDLAIEAATCEDGACFESKREAFVLIKLHDAYTDKAAVKLSWKNSEAAPRMAKDGSGPNELQVLRLGQWIEAKKGSCDTVRNGVAVDWDEYNSRQERKPGQTFTVCIAMGCKAHPKSYEKKAREVSPGRTPAQREEEERKRREAVNVENQLRMGQAIEALERVTVLPWQALRGQLLSMVKSHRVDVRKIKAHLYPGFDVAIETAAVDSAAFAKAVAVLTLELNGLGIEEWERPDSERNDFLHALKRLGYDGAKAWEKPKAAAKKAAPAKKAAAKKAAAKQVKKAAAKKPAAKPAKKLAAKKKSVRK